MDTSPDLPTTPLAAGQSLHLAVDAGTVLVAVQGDLRVDEPPRWLAGMLLPVGSWVGEGQSHVVTRAGWVRVTAQRDARLAQTLPASTWARLAAWLAQWVGARRQPGQASAGKA